MQAGAGFCFRAAAVAVIRAGSLNTASLGQWVEPVLAPCMVLCWGQGWCWLHLSCMALAAGVRVTPPSN